MKLEGTSRLDVQLNITPLIDIVFLLLIFYMLTSSLLQDQALEVSLPKSSTSSSVEKSPLVVTLRENGTLFFQDKVLSNSQLEEALKLELLETADEMIIIRSDQEVPVQKLISLMDLVKQSGAKNLSIATEGSE